jgi:hypothetical protein
MIALFVASILSVVSKAEKYSNKKSIDRNRKPLSDPDPDLDGCYDAYVALKNALSVTERGSIKNEKKISVLAEKVYTDFATQCPTTADGMDCSAAYLAVEALEVDDEKKIETFVADCKVDEPEKDGGDDKKAGDIGFYASKFNNIFLLMIMTLTGFYFNS